MPIYEGNNLIEHVYVGSILISEVYAGVDLVHQEPLTQIVTMVSGTDQDLLTLLNAASVNPVKPVIVNMADGQILGGVSAEALTLIGLGAYASITINLSGQWQGGAGTDAIRSDQNLIIQNGGTISGDVSDVSGGATSNITIAIGATGMILAGGGNGGNGGNGGFGNDLNWSGYQFSENNYMWRNPTRVRPRELVIYWAGSLIYQNLDEGNTTTSYKVVSNNHYQRGSQYSSAPSTGSWQDVRYRLRRGTIINGVAGTGGSGGNGEGYLATRTDGTPGTAGTNRAGAGGDGGNGGSWGIDGGNGFIGQTGTYYLSNGSSANAGGSSGTSGTNAGFSIVSTGTVIYI